MTRLFADNFWPAQQRQTSSFFLSPTVFFFPFYLCFLWRWAVQNSPRCRQSTLSAEKMPANLPVKEITSPLPHFATTGTPHRAFQFLLFKGANTPPIKPSLSNEERLALLICVNYQSLWQRNIFFPLKSVCFHVWRKKKKKRKITFTY